MKDMTWYIVEVAFSMDNSIHRAICFHRYDGLVDLHGHYDGVALERNSNKMPYFEVISELKEMNVEETNSNMLTPRMKKN